MFCPRCGSQLHNNEEFCSNCGIQIDFSSSDSTPESSTIKHSHYKRFGKKTPWIIGVITTIAVVIALVFIMPDIINDTADSNASFSTEMLPGLVFDDSDTVTISSTQPNPVVSGISPASGTMGTTIIISGTDIVSAGIESVMLNDTEMSIASISDGNIDVIVPFNAASGNISLVYATDKTVDAGYFEVEPLEKQLWGKKTISPSADAQTVTAQNVSLTIPGGVLETEQTVRIEQIKDMSYINLPPSISGTMFSVTVGDIHQFNNTLTIEYSLEDSDLSAPAAAYFNEETMMWDMLPSEMEDGKLHIYTDHLTDFCVFSMSEATWIYSPDESFKIFYQTNDTFSYPGVSSIEAFAQKVGATLEKIRKDYEAKIPKEYREDFSNTAMNVFLSSSSYDRDEGKYLALTNCMVITTKFANQDKFETLLAHELFHSYQDAVWNEIKGIGKMSKSANVWAVEALAELAAYELAFPEKDRQREIENGVTSRDSYNTLDGSHEYSMSCFLRYLLHETNSTFKELWMSVVSNSKITLDVCINDFFKSKSNNFISLDVSYIDFWQDVVSDKDAPVHAGISTLIDRRSIYLIPQQHTAEFSYQMNKESTTSFNLFGVNGFSANMPQRIFNVNCTAGSVIAKQLPGIRNASAINDARTLGGYNWDYVYGDTSIGDNHILYTFNQGSDSVALIGFENIVNNTQFDVKISEIQAQSNPQKIDGVIPGMEQKFEVGFKDIFDYVQDIEVVVDFGDGTVKKFTKTNDTGVFSGWITHTFGENIIAQAVTFSMYDVSGGSKELISQLVIPMTTGEAVTLSASPNPAQIGEPVSLQVNITDAGYTYRWDFGDGQTATMYDTNTSHVYDTAGTYIATVTVIDLDDSTYGTARQMVTVEAQTETATPLLTTEPPGPPEETHATNEVPIADMTIQDLDGIEWSGTGKLTNVNFIEAYVEEDGEEADETVKEIFFNENKTKYNSWVGVESECVFMYGNSILACILRSDDEGDDFKYVPCYITGATIVEGELVGQNGYEGGEEVKIKATLTRDTDGLLIVEGTADYTDVCRYNEEHPNQADKVEYSFTFTVKEVPK